MGIFVADVTLFDGAKVRRRQGVLVDVGHVADLALWDGNPVDDPGTLAKPRAVWKDGVRA
jgi:imidazolonepropionase-like amidohydrolase